MLIEEYVEGEVISLEVIGDGSHFAVVKETLIHIDETYDCHMVTPLPLDPSFRADILFSCSKSFLKRNYGRRSNFRP